MVLRGHINLDFGLSSIVCLLNNLNYESWQCVLFQRVTVICGDFVLAYGVKEYLSTLRESGRYVSVGLKRVVLSVLILFNSGLLLVDHVHFQYNGMLFGILLLSIAKLKEGNVLCGAFWFAVLLNFKHIYLYIAPAYFVYLLRSYCFQKSDSFNWVPKLSTFLPRNFVRLGFVVIAVFGVSFGPFLALGQFNQVFVRLFPFKRGLTHAYWAPNFWALYNFADKIAVSIGSHFGLSISNTSGQAVLTGGLVGDIEHSVLPSISPLITLLLTLLTVLPALLKVWTQPHDFGGFVRCIVLCGLSSFLFGWHVHEKAILLVLVPLSLLSVCHYSDAGMYVIISTTGHVSLFPLLFLQQAITHWCHFLSH
ncbi:probable dolichyl pyrophosphate Glc1Man9GlcNAc2 alpha-1,3-glucosyltransferase isoform X2 [Corticium candelabrum]|uniref:probable dolichyl pyrophosphate Glc1Man9GlcNAc2 alpha-1,3-glucosyltransferase isoform X2 n=1 Tax=Corticium candelabrum TaxID=121492 RepID=UPI002E25579E|nr:probable dolichyl pyrophosphate Glc1Man9GlcNAc2 alpha-1,3-glucosyltransferase isoform X2 [Corticium candelabrum]